MGKDDASDGQAEASDELDTKKIGIGMDSAVIPVSRHPGMFLVQTVDFFYPLIDDPYLMGKIAFANVVSDVYATGVATIDKIKMIISAPDTFTEKQRDVVIPLIIKGFKDSASEIKTNVDIDWMAVNPWCIIGGIATSVCHESEILFPTAAQAGDVLVLTKPLGTQIATNAYIWMKEDSDEWKKLRNSGNVTQETITQMYETAANSMSFLNKTAADLMHKYNGHAATDVTGFGLLGHAQNLAIFQKENVSFELHTLPIIKHVLTAAKILNRETRLREGKAVETSGGLLIAMPQSKAQEYCEEFEQLSGFKAFIIGNVFKGEKKAQMSENINFIEV